MIMAEKNVHVKIKNVSKIYADKTIALSDINLDIYENEVMVLLGPSGCGKSTLLRIIAGLHAQNSGQVLLYNKDISHLPPEKRDVGFVFQSYALFPTMTVRENISFGLKIRRKSKKEIADKVDELMEMMNITRLADRKPTQLSGGEQQRVAIARVLAIEPRLLLMDEPLTALDAKLKEHLKVELSTLFHRLEITTIYVTHDQDEAMSVADRIAILNRGVIEQVGTPEEIYTQPRTDFVAQFIGKINKIQSALSSGVIDLGFTKLPYPDTDRSGAAIAYIRPEAFAVTNEDTPSSFSCKVMQKIYLGKNSVILLDACGQPLRIEINSSIPAEVGQTLRLTVDPSKLYIF